MNEMKVLLVAIGGYGAGNVRVLLDHGEEHQAKIVGIVEPYPNSCPYIDEVLAHNIPIYSSIESFYAEGQADLAVISSPIQFHAEQAVYAMEHGSHILLEKPASANMEGVEQIRDACKRTGKRCAIGYQWCFNPAMLALKRDILAGVLGAPVSMRSITLWPRAESYYKRGIGWAGKRFDAQGRAINDSVAANATAHYLMNMLWLLGDQIDTAASLENMRSSSARVNQIDMFDTLVLRAEARGVQVLYITSHAVSDIQGPDFDYVFERGTLSFEAANGDAPLVVKMNDGSTRTYEGMAQHEALRPKLWTTIDAIRTGGMIPCTVDTAAAHVEVMDFVNAQPIADLSAEGAHAYDAQQQLHHIVGLEKRLLDCYTLFGEPLAYLID